MTAVRLALLDRDGTINRKAPEGEYVRSPSELELLAGAAQAIAELNRAGVPVAVVTNQRGVALGRMSLADVEAVHDALGEALRPAGAHVDAFYVCPHENHACACRKPQPGMLLAASRDFGVGPADAVMIGDAESDVEAGRRFGARTIRLVAAPSGPGEAADLASAVAAVLA